MINETHWWLISTASCLTPEYKHRSIEPVIRRTKATQNRWYIELGLHRTRIDRNRERKGQREICLHEDERGRFTWASAASLCRLICAPADWAWPPFLSCCDWDMPALALTTYLWNVLWLTTSPLNNTEHQHQSSNVEAQQSHTHDFKSWRYTICKLIFFRSQDRKDRKIIWC